MQTNHEEIKKTNLELNKIIDQIQIKQKYRLATDDNDEITTADMVKKLIDTDVILKAFNAKFMNLANYVANYSKYSKFDLNESDEIYFKNYDLGTDFKTKYQHFAPVEIGELKNSYNLLLRNIKILIDKHEGKV